MNKFYILLSLFLITCDAKSKLAGVWTHQNPSPGYSVQTILNEDNSMTMTINNESWSDNQSWSGTWSIKGNYITFNMDGGVKVYKYRFDGYELILINESTNSENIYKKQ